MAGRASVWCLTPTWSLVTAPLLRHSDSFSHVSAPLTNPASVFAQVYPQVLSLQSKPNNKQRRASHH